MTSQTEYNITHNRKVEQLPHLVLGILSLAEDPLIYLAFVEHIGKHHHLSSLLEPNPGNFRARIYTICTPFLHIYRHIHDVLHLNTRYLCKHYFHLMNRVLVCQGETYK
jgi:hypothetical protein